MSNQYTKLNISNNNGLLAQIWLAANMSNVPRNSALQTSITNSAKEIAKAAGFQLTNDSNSNNNIPKKDEHITLRTSGELLQGIVRVYSKQAGFLLSDIKDTLIKISSLFKNNSTINVTISKNNAVTKISQLILEDVVTEKEVLSIPNLNFLNDDNGYKSGLINNNNDDMNRQVQGVSKAKSFSPWDTSIEYGRKNIDNEQFDYNNDNNSMDDLDLDFDIDNTNIISNEKSWLEGTNNNSILTSAENKQPKIIDNENDNWNLHEHEMAADEIDYSNEDSISIELGRKADVTAGSEVTEFNFDLDIEKEQINDENNLQQEELSLENNNNDARTKSHNPVLKNTTNIKLDELSELPNKEMKDIKDIIAVTDSINDSFKPRLTQKRLWKQMIQQEIFLPNVITQNLVNYNYIKKPKVVNLENIDMIDNDINDDIVDISLDEDNLGLGNNENNDQDHTADFIDSLGSDMVEEDGRDEISNNIIATETDSQSTNSRSLKNDQVKLLSGETVSKTTLELAAIIKEETQTDETISYDTILSKQYGTSDLESMDTSISQLTKKEACACFFDMLSLATSDCITLNQEEPFGKITLSPKDAIFEKYVTA